jgi:fructosamine-3-kinase
MNLSSLTQEILGCRLIESRPLQGGDINNVFLLQTENGPFVAKINSASAFPLMFQREAEGLNLIINSGAIRCPEVIFAGQNTDDAVLLLEYIPQGRASLAFWEDFGRKLAALHRCSAAFYGLEQDNYIGSLPQYNSPMESWPAFFITQRLMPQIEIAAQKGLLDNKTKNGFSNLCTVLPTLLPEEVPSLIHGDLWNGNYLTDTKGCPVLIDPAVSYASREMDLAMSRLFGGFSPAFYGAYYEAFPVEKGIEDRLLIYQLYYLMVHVNLFGGSYLSSVKRILERF